MSRDVTKTMSFAVLHFTVAFTIAYALTGSTTVATGIGLIEPLANSVAFFFHERLWRRIDPQIDEQAEPQFQPQPWAACRH